MHGHALEVGILHTLVHDRVVEHLARRQAPHLDQPVDRGAAPVELQVGMRVERERHRAEVDLGRQAPVQPDLFLAIKAPGFERAKVEQLIAHRFLELVDIGAGQEHP